MCLRTTSSAPGAVCGLKLRVTNTVSGSEYVKSSPSCACSGDPPDRCFCNVILGRNFMLAKKCHF